MWIRVVGTLVILAALGAAEAQAQSAWGSPLLLPPKPQGGFGIFVIDPSGGDVGVLGTWRGSGNLGYRLGFAKDYRHEMGLFGGVDVRDTLVEGRRSSDEFVPDIAWVTGAGIGIGTDALITFPLGLSIGHTFDADDVRFTPYLAPRVLLDAYFSEVSGFSLSLAVDLGIDIALQSNWMIRFGMTFGNRNALAVGAVL